MLTGMHRSTRITLWIPKNCPTPKWFLVTCTLQGRNISYIPSNHWHFWVNDFPPFLKVDMFSRSLEGVRTLTKLSCPPVYLLHTKFIQTHTTVWYILFTYIWMEIDYHFFPNKFQHVSSTITPAWSELDPVGLAMWDGQTSNFWRHK